MVSYFAADSLTHWYEHHRDKRNQLIHFVTVPLVTWSFMMLLSQVNMPTIAEGVMDPYVSNLAFVLFFTVTLYYIILDHLAGAIIAVQYVIMMYFAIVLRDNMSGFDFNAFNVTIQIICWSAQLYGHIAFEEKTFSWIDFEFSAIMAAPLFVLLEAMFFVGYEQDLKGVVERRIKYKQSLNRSATATS
jgi:uncharacterized membrane protein YGL010W